MATRSIPDEVKDSVLEIVDRFNQKRDLAYSARFRGRYLYLDRDDGGGLSPICRLTYTGDMKSWEFAIYKYSTDRYDPDEWFLPGLDEIDGTVEGAMLAGLEAYE